MNTTPAQHASAQTVVTYRQGYARAELLLNLIDSQPEQERAAVTRETIRELCIEHAELMASIKRPKPLPALPVDPLDDGIPRWTRFGDPERPSRFVEGA